ncbi:MAG: hypothetical protein EOM05_08425 [Clostridia bacterium]|nr:hypothetical protein [Clostridia bacterium]
MKDRDRRKLYAILTFLAAIAIVVTSALSVTFVAFGVFFVYGRKNFLAWNEKRKAENAANKKMGIKKEPGIIARIRAKIKKIISNKARDVISEKPIAPKIQGVQVEPAEFNKISKLQQEAPVIITCPDFIVPSSKQTKPISSAQPVANYAPENATYNDSKYEDDYLPSFSAPLGSRFRGIKF